jgi:NADPH:quinone reductase-like Zn-dependent oxidoreductase
MQAIVFDQAGDPDSVVTTRDVPAPVPAAGQVLIAVESSPIHPADLFFVRGAYRAKPAFPQVAGLSGVGRVVAAGAGVTLPAGAKVAFRWPGAWAELAVAPVDRVYEVPPEIPSEAAAQLPVNPITAWGLLDFARVTAGDYIALTGASSSVASLVAVLAHERGVGVLGVVRASSRAPLPGNVLRLVEDAPDLAGRLRAAAGGRGVAALLDCVGGPLLGALFPALETGATVVAYGALGPEPTVVHNNTLIYSNLSWLGFGIDRFLESLPAAARAQMLAALWSGIAAGRLPLPVQARFPLGDFAEALRRARSGRPGKVHLMPRGA